MTSFQKQPAEVLDYDVDFSDWLDADTISSVVATAATGLNVASSIFSNTTKIVKVWLNGGTTGNTYKVTVRVTTGVGRVKEVDFNLVVTEL
jgi:hypothetical protein